MVIGLKREASLRLYVDKTMDSERQLAQPSVLVLLVIAFQIRFAVKCSEGEF